MFAHLPPPQELFEASLERKLLKTAGGYLLVLHNFNDLESSSEQCVRLLQHAKEAGDWELCKELARFLMALDTSGETLQKALAKIDLTPTVSKSDNSDNVRLKTPQPGPGRGWKRYDLNGGMRSPRSLVGSAGSRSPKSLGTTPEDEGYKTEEDYFSPRSSMTD